MFTTFDKAIAGLIVPAILTILIGVGITPDMTVEQALTILVSAIGTGILTGVSVYQVRNKKG